MKIDNDAFAELDVSLFFGKQPAYVYFRNLTSVNPKPFTILYWLFVPSDLNLSTFFSLLCFRYICA